MALGGGIFTVQNKVLPGSYISFISTSMASSTLSDRGVAAIALPLDWGVDGEVFSVSSEDFEKNAIKIFGYDYSSDNLRGIRDLFKNVKLCYFYKLGDGVKASNTYATAKYKGVRGNDIKISINTNVDDEEKFDVITYLGTKIVDSQTVSASSELLANDFVDFKTATLGSTSAMPLAGGANPESIQGADYQSFLSKIESYSFNALGCISTDDTIKALFGQFTKRLRDEIGSKFTCVLYRHSADYEGVISVENAVLDSGESSGVYWVLGACAGAAINESITNKKYDGEFKINTDYSQSTLSDGIQSGKFMLHNVSGDVRVLKDINSLVSITDEIGEDFKSNQTIRVLDQIAKDIATIFSSKYLGQVQNDASGRISLWNDIVKHHQDMEKIRAIENFNPDEILVTEGDTKMSVVVSDRVTPANSMAQLYMTVIVS